MTYSVISFSAKNTDEKVSARCPGCGKRVTFESISERDVTFMAAVDKATNTVSSYTTGQRRCPDPECRSLVFFVTGHTGLECLYPVETLEFDTSSIPEAVASPMAEAVRCHAAECYVATAIMVRKTLEELCRDRGAEGSNLKKRVASLRDKVVIPKELLDGADDLRLLGNDAAHVESQDFNAVEKEEAEIGIEFAKEVLKSVYQYSDLLGRLRALKKGT